MQEHNIAGGKAELQKVLEACTKELLKHDRYVNDIRFLRIWIQYVRFLFLCVVCCSVLGLRGACVVLG